MERTARTYASRAGLPSAPQPSFPGAAGSHGILGPAAVMMACLTLAACGGGGGGPLLAAPVNSVAASSNVDNLVQSSLATSPSLSSGQRSSKALSIIGAVSAHSAGYTGITPSRKRIRVAVVDSGFDVNHPDLRDNFIWRENQDRATDYPLGRNFAYAPDDNKDDVRVSLHRGTKAISHGTHVAGIIAARDNGFGVKGVAPDAELIPMRFLQDGIPDEFSYMADIDPEHESLEEGKSELANVFKFADDNDAFVVNNSWHLSWRPRVVEIDVPGGSKRYFLQPRVVQRGYESFTSRLLGDSTVQNILAANEDGKEGMAIIFSAGNGGWNSDTGHVAVFEEKFEGDQINRYRNYDQRKSPSFLPATAPQIARTGTPSNLPTPLSAAFLGNKALEGLWLAVVATDGNNKIANFSNGCGVAARYCLAAPGVRVLSTLHADDTEIGFPRTKEYGLYSGTSMAAPVVSGAAAVVKSKAPNLTARQVVDILLRTATDLGAPGTDLVYGHGLVNLARALQPIGQQNAAGGKGSAVAASADTRIAFSSAFGNAAPAATHHFGGLDSYGRVYRYRAPLQDRVLPGPRLSGVLALNNAPPPMMIGRSGGTATYLRSSTDPQSAVGDGSALSVIGARGRVDLAVARRRTSSLLSPAALLAEDAEDAEDKGTSAPPHDWGALAPQSRDLVSGGAGWRLSPRLATGAYFSRALAEGATRRGEAYGMTDLGVSARIGNGESGIGLHLGRLSEDGRFLGSKPEGGYALAGPTRSGYLRLSASRRLSRRLSVGVNVMRLRARVDFRHDEFVEDTRITARSGGAYLALRDAGRTGGRLVLHYGEPLAVTGGAIRQSSVMGYTAGGAYKPVQSSLDLGVRSRHRMTQVMYRAPLADGVSGFAAAAHHRNWSHQRGLGNNLVMVGLSVRR
ncbi:MAG: S8 family peptidase [Candidatus Puniceispirillaceae bacterium]